MSQNMFSSSNRILTVSVMITIIGALLTGLALYIGCYSTAIHPKFSDDENISRLNNTFYSEKKFFYTPKIKDTNFIESFTKAIREMKSCRIDRTLLRYFYGEGGIGKTTMLHEALRELNPFPYVLLRLESVNTWNDVGVKLSMTSTNELGSMDELVVFGTLTNYFHHLNRADCPLIIIDGANRNSKITNTFIAFWRDISHERPFALLMISSEGVYNSISRGGGRVMGIELSPSESFVRAYLKDKGIIDPTLVSEIMEITGNKIGYLRMINSPHNVLNILEQIVNENLEEYLELLRKHKAFKYFKKLVKVLLNNPQETMATLDSIPDKKAVKIFKSNLLRRYGHNDYRFQNKAVERFFRRNWN